MKLNATMLVVAAMMVGSVGALGCSKSQDQDKITDKGNDVGETTTATPEDNPASAAVSEDKGEANPTVEQDYWRGNRYWAPRAPPAARFERPGEARAGHFWRPGYYGWSGRDYIWYNGAYYPERPGYRYVNPEWHAVGPRWGYRAGRWVRR